MSEERLADIEKEVEEFRQFRKDHDQNMKDLKKCVEKNTTSIQSLADSMEAHAASTEGVVKTFEELVAFATVGKRVHSFLWSVAKIPLIGAGLYQLLKWLIDNMPEI